MIYFKYLLELNELMLKTHKELHEIEEFPHYDIYTPIVCNDIIIHERFNKTIDCYSNILNLMPKDFNKSSIFEVGTNTGYLLLEIKRKNNPGMCVGIDQHDLILKIPEKIVEIEKLENIEFKVLDIFNDNFDNFDYIIINSVTGAKQKYENYNKNINPDAYKPYKEFLDICIKKTNKSIFTEPTQYGTNKDNYVDIHIDFFNSFDGIKDAKYLGPTDLKRGRGLFELIIN